MPCPVPLVLLTGFLGAGKTTVLNRVLGAQHHLRVAVIVNELGRIDIDGKLLRARAGDIVELAGGCVCHEVRTMEELWDGLDEVIVRARPDVIVLETTGIAEPQPILDGLGQQPPARRRRSGGDQAKDAAPAVQAAGVVTVVDVDAGSDQLQRFPEARAQVRAADRLLLSKMDLGRPERMRGLFAALDALNDTAERATFPDTGEGTTALAGWLLEARPRFAAVGDPAEAGLGRAGHAHAHAHGAQLAAVGHVDDRPLMAEPLIEVCRRLGTTLVRAKGFVDIVGEPRQGFLERAGSQLSLRFGDPWPPGPRHTRLVLIGEALDSGAIRRQLWACRAGGAADAEGQSS